MTDLPIKNKSEESGLPLFHPTKANFTLIKTLPWPILPHRVKLTPIANQTLRHFKGVPPDFFDEKPISPGVIGLQKLGTQRWVENRG